MKKTVICVVPSSSMRKRKYVYKKKEAKGFYPLCCNEDDTNKYNEIKYIFISDENNMKSRVNIGKGMREAKRHNNGSKVLSFETISIGTVERRKEAEKIIVQLLGMTETAEKIELDISHAKPDIAVVLSIALDYLVKVNACEVDAMISRDSTRNGRKYNTYDLSPTFYLMPIIDSCRGKGTDNYRDALINLLGAR